MEIDDNFGFQSWKMIDDDLQRIDAEVFDHDSPDWQHDFLRLITLNIRSGRNSNLNVVLRTMHQMRVDLGILTETKIDNEMYTRDCCGYTVLASHARSKHQGGVALFIRQRIHVGGLRVRGPMALTLSVVFLFQAIAVGIL